MATREQIRSAALPLFERQDIADTSVAEIAAAAGIDEAEFYELFAAPVNVVLDNDHYARLLDIFVSESAQLSPSGAWIVALDEAASAMDATVWANESTRQRIVDSDPAVAPFLVPFGLSVMELTKQAVATRTGLPADSNKVAAFAGALIGSIAGMPSGSFADPQSWIAAHAGANEALGASLDKLLQ